LIFEDREKYISLQSNELATLKISEEEIEEEEIENTTSQMT